MPTRTQHITLDMLISTLETVWTFSIAYPTAVSLGKILLQTAPERAPSGSGGPMEAFLRAMREVRTVLSRHLIVTLKHCLWLRIFDCILVQWSRLRDIPTSSTSQHPTSGSLHCLVDR